MQMDIISMPKIICIIQIMFVYQRYCLIMMAKTCMMEKLYWPYAKALADVVTECLDRFSSCLIIDAHSFPSEPLPYEDARLERPDICFGHDPYHVPCDVLEKLKGTCADRGRHVADNSPFAGSYVPLSYYRSDSQVKSLMIEINREQYMNEADGEKSDL